jgi:hypothetical protein
MIKTFLKETIEGDGLASQERGFAERVLIKILLPSLEIPHSDIKLS